jgi:hypothetical protein
MKRKTILKTIGFFIGWLASFQLICVGTHLMSQPSNILFTFGMLVTVSTFGTIFYFAGSTGRYMAKLLREHSESKEVEEINQNKKEQL